MDPNQVQSIKSVVICTVIVLNITLNSIAIAVIARYPQLREDRTALFVFSLLLSDLLAGCTALPISAVACVSATPDEYHATYLAETQLFFVAWFSFNSVHSLCWLTVTKMVALLHPFRYEQLFSHRRCYVVIGCVWLAGALTAGVSVRTFVPWNSVTCTYDRPVDSGTSVAITVGFVLGVVPLIAMMYATARIFCVVVRTHHQMAAQVSSIGGQVGTGGHSSSLTLQSVRSGRNVLLVCLGVLVLSVPIITLVLLGYTGGPIHSVSETFVFAAVWLAMSNSFVNSLLYLILFRSVRKKTKTLLREMYNWCNNVC